MRKIISLSMLVVSGTLTPSSSQTIENTVVGRLEAQAILETLNASLLSHDSATLTLERWCGLHRLAAEGEVHAEVVRAEQRPADDRVRNDLGVGADEPVRYRHVRLWCGDKLLSEADNWYLPRALTVGMNEELEQSDTPFGRVVKPLGFRRRTLSAELLWHPLPEGWEMAPLPPDREGTVAVPPEILRHRAILTAANGAPFSEVVETYRADLFAFTLPKR